LAVLGDEPKLESYIWDLMGCELRNHPKQPTTSTKLENVVQKIWEEIPHAEISRCRYKEIELNKVIN